MLTAFCYSSQYCFTFFCSFSWHLTESVCSTNALPIAMHRQTRTLFLFTYAKIPHVCAPILHKYNTDVTDPQAFMPASAWHSCRDAALFPNYLGQTCWLALVHFTVSTMIRIWFVSEILSLTLMYLQSVGGPCVLRGCKNWACSVSWPEVIKDVPNQQSVAWFVN